MPVSLHLKSSAGFTLVEVMVAVLLLSIGVLATLAMSDGANRATAQTKAREGANSVARDVLEATHAIPWAKLTPSTTTGSLQAMAGLADSDPAQGGWQLARRDTTYTIAVSVCSIDDPADGLGSSVDATFCARAGSSGKPADANPADMKRATLTVSWRDQSGPRTLTQVTTITSTYSGPAVAALSSAALPGEGPWTYSGPLSALQFRVTTDQPATAVQWLLNGTKQDAAIGAGTS